MKFKIRFFDITTKFVRLGSYKTIPPQSIEGSRRISNSVIEDQW